MKGVWAVPVIASILILGTLVIGFIPNASAAQGTITAVTSTGTHGTIQEDGCEGPNGKCQYQFQIPRDLADPNYIPQVGDKVTFISKGGRMASDITRILPSLQLQIYVNGELQFFEPSQLQSTDEGFVTQDEVTGVVSLSLDVVCVPFDLGCSEFANISAIQGDAVSEGTTINFKLIQIAGIPQNNVSSSCFIFEIFGTAIQALPIPPADIGDNIVTLAAAEPDGIILFCQLFTSP